MSVGSPRFVHHEIHVDRDTTQSCGLAGLPSEWLHRMIDSGFSGDEISSHSDEILAAFKLAGTARSTAIFSATHRSRRGKMLPIADVDPRTLYTNMTHIANGSNGDIYSAIDNQTATDVVLKKVPIPDDAALATVTEEVNFMNGLSHPTLLKCLRSHRYEYEVWIVMELMDLGCLAEYVEVAFEYGVIETCFTEEDIAFILWRVLEGLCYLHESGRMHRDLKSDNLFVSSQGDIKLGDFGASCRVEDVATSANTVVGTTLWMAPEVVHGNLYDASADIWSFGILAYELAYGEPPYMGVDQVRALYLIVMADAPTLPESSTRSPLFRDFLARALVKDPRHRSTARQLLGHEFFQTVSDYKVQTLVQKLGALKALA